MVFRLSMRTAALALLLASGIVGGVVAVGCGLNQAGIVASIDGSAGPDASRDANDTPDQTTPVDSSPPEGDASTDAGGIDAIADTSVDANVDGGCDACSQDTPSGWTLVAFATTRANPCPVATTTVDVIENPSASDPACTCPTSCTPGTADCTQASVTVSFGTGGCSQVGDTFPGNGGACSPLPGGDNTLEGDHTGIGNAVTVDQNCTPPSPVAMLSTVVSQSDRMCAPTSPTCSAAVCGALPSAFTTCLVMGGDQACPASAPHKHAVGTAPTLSCGACTCTEQTSCSGSFTLYGNSTCGTGGGGGSFSISISPNTCVPTPQNQAVGSYAWASTGQAAATLCQGTGTSVPTVGLQGAETVCCP